MAMDPAEATAGVIPPTPGYERPSGAEPPVLRPARAQLRRQGSPFRLTPARAVGWAAAGAGLAALFAPQRLGRAGERNVTLLAFVAAVAAFDVAISTRKPTRSLTGSASHPYEFLEQSTIIDKPPSECYAFWHDLKNLPRFMPMLESVEDLGSGKSRWVLNGPGGVHLEWDAQMTRDEPGRLIGWRSLPNSHLAHAGVVRFEPAPGDRGTVVRVVAHYQPLMTSSGKQFARFLHSNPDARVREDLRRFKQLLETGEVATTAGQPSGPRSLLGRAIHKWSEV
jgi:uncharacterized membrane protein